MTRRASASVPLLSAVVLACGAFLWARILPARASLDTSAEPSTALAVRLLSLGLSAERLAAAGVGPAQVNVLVAGLDPHLQQHGAALDAALARVQETQARIDRLSELVQSGNASPSEVAALEQDRSALEAARGEHDVAQQAAFDASCAGIPEAQRLRLARMRSNAGWSLPSEYLVMEQSERDWVFLRDALAAERYSQAKGTALPTRATQILTAARSDPAVALARASKEVLLSSVTSAWNTALAD